MVQYFREFVVAAIDVFRSLERRDFDVAVFEAIDLEAQTTQRCIDPDRVGAVAGEAEVDPSLFEYL